MKFLKRIFSKEIFSKTKTPQAAISAKGMLLYPSTAEVIKAETLLRAQGLDIAVKGPPPDLRKGCDMIVEFDLMHELFIGQILQKNHLQPLDIVPVQDHLLEPVSLFKVKDFGDYLMVRAANMKITIHKSDKKIVNISGGGCPDVPYLAQMLVGQTLDQAPEPRTLGQTLCGYALQLAFEEVRRICPG